MNFLYENIFYKNNGFYANASYTLCHKNELFNAAAILFAIEFADGDGFLNSQLFLDDFFKF